MISDSDRSEGRRKPNPQIACDDCSLGVMDATNPHLWGDCRHSCHAARLEDPAPIGRRGGPVSGDVGPYIDPNGPRVWVPRTVPYLEARRVARDAIQVFDQRLRYVGKADAELMGFARDCFCEEACERRWRDDDDTGDRACTVPAWAFVIEEPS